MHRFTRILPAILLLLVAACRTAPVYNVSDATFGKTLTMSQAELAIQRAGADLGWNITPQSPGMMRGVLDLRSHQAVVNILYDRQNFSINYADSKDLNYTGTEIHKNYNSWVQNLEKQIRVEALKL